MIVLGIADSLTCGAALIANGKGLAAVNEERLNRRKMSMGFPQESISEVLRIASLEMKDVEHIAVATNSLFGYLRQSSSKIIFVNQKVP